MKTAPPGVMELISRNSDLAAYILYAPANTNLYGFWVDDNREMIGAAEVTLVVTSAGVTFSAMAATAGTAVPANAVGFLGWLAADGVTYNLSGKYASPVVPTANSLPIPSGAEYSFGRC